jgi:hypothetical protein
MAIDGLPIQRKTINYDHACRAHIVLLHLR